MNVNVNVNVAGADELDSVEGLRGHGFEIVRYREERGRFGSLRQLDGEALAAAIEEDFRRWELFDKTPRIASHSAEGVIELMPTSDGTTYGFKYVNGHPRNTRQGRQTVTAFGVLAVVSMIGGAGSG